MSLTNFHMGDLEEDPFFGQHMRSMRQMNNMMNSLFADPFGMFGGGGFGMNNALMGHMGGQRNSMPGFGGGLNRLLAGGYNDGNSMSYSSSSVFSMSSGADGRPQVYQASSSTRTGPGGIKETKRSVQDSQSGVKKLALGYHINDRAHVVEKEQNVHTGEMEERQEFINLTESDGEDFDREFQQKARSSQRPHRRLQIEEISSEPLQAIQSAEDIQQQNNRNRTVTPRRSIRTTSSPLALPTSTNSPTRHVTTSVHPHPYNPQSSRKGRSMKGQHHNNHY